MSEKIRVSEIKILGMPLTQMEYKSCVARFGVGDTWATLYDIRSKIEGKGHATILLSFAKQYYEKQGKKFGGSVALNERMRRLYKKLDITEYTE